ncbi:protein of unknown function [Hyphomicrobium sp. MC1]|nr:protein of unknown function [Hyphomicrobium sp. MC1]
MAEDSCKLKPFLGPTWDDKRDKNAKKPVTLCYRSEFLRVVITRTMRRIKAVNKRFSAFVSCEFRHIACRQRPRRLFRYYSASGAHLIGAPQLLHHAAICA